MHVCFAWQSGPFFEDKEKCVFEAKRVREVKLGGPSNGESRFLLPGAKDGDVWFVVYIEDETVSVLNDDAPYPLTIRRKCDGVWEELQLATNQTAEAKSNDILIFGPDGPRILCEYKIDMFDKARMGESYLPSAHGLKSVGPVNRSSFRRLKNETKKAKEEAEKARKEAEEAIRKAREAEEAAKEAERKARENRKRITILATGGASLVLVVAVSIIYFSGRINEFEASFNKSIAQLEDFEKNLQDLKKSRETAKAEIERILAQLDNTSDPAEKKELT